MKPRSPTLSRLPGSNIIDQTVGPKCLARRDAKAARQSCASNTGGLHLDVCPPVIARKCQLAVGMSHVLSTGGTELVAPVQQWRAVGTRCRRADVDALRQWWQKADAMGLGHGLDRKSEFFMQIRCLQPVLSDHDGISATAPGSRESRRHLLILVAIAAVAAIATSLIQARAQDATWLTAPGSPDYNTASNWSTGAVPSGTALFGVSTITNLSLSADAAADGWTFNAGASNYIFTDTGHHLQFNGAGIIVNGGAATILNAGLIDFNNSSTAGNATIVTNAVGFLAFNATSNAGNATLTINNGGQLDFNNSSSAASSNVTNNNGGILNFNDTSTAANATIINATGGHLTFNGASTAGAAAITNTGLINFNNTSTAANAAIVNNAGAFSNFNNSTTAGNSTITVNNGGETDFFNTSTGGSATIAVNGGGLLNFNDNSTSGNAVVTTNNLGTTSFLGAASGGNARVVVNGTGRVDISKLTVASMTAGSIEGDGTVRLGSKNLTVGGNNTSTTFSGVLADGGLGGGTGGSLTHVGTGTLILSGTSTYTGATSVNAGTLLVDGSIASSSLLTVNSGATAGGSGILPTTVITSGGALSPGDGAVGTATVNGSLTFNSGSTYVVHVSSVGSSRTNVTGSANLAGTVNAQVASASLGRAYTILSAAGGLGQTTFDAIASSNPNFNASLSYTSTDVLLNLAATLGAQGALATNQQNVANVINSSFNGGGALPANFASLFNLTGSDLATALSRLSGEPATGAQIGAFQLTDEFLGLMTDFDDVNRPGDASAWNGAAGTKNAFANERKGLPADVRQAYAAVLKAPAASKGIPSRWSAWVAPFGGYNATDGKSAIGSHDVDTRTYGVAAGLAYHLTAESLLGFALAGGATNWGLEQGLGGGRSDAFLAGAYGKTWFGPAYVKAALSYANHWESTDRYAPFGDHLSAKFNGYGFGARLESGYRFGTAERAISPYAAVQWQSFHLPAFSESDLTNGGFGLNYASHAATDTRSELGVRFDKIVAASADSVLAVRFGMAWAHDWITDPSLTATFQELPTANFVVTGASLPSDSALLTAGAEWKLASGVSIGGKFDGSFAGRSQTYSGSGVLKYSW